MKIVVYGGTGYVGRKVAAVGHKLGHEVICPTRNGKKVDDVQCVPFESPLPDGVELVISCMGSSTGTPEDCEKIDNLANRKVADACREAKCKFIYVSGQCVTAPKLELQFSKLRCEWYLQSFTDLDWVIVRPTAFFKSFVPVMQRAIAGKPCIVFGDGKVGRFNPIDAEELGEFILKEAAQQTQVILPVGGPIDRGNMLTSLDLTRRCFEVYNQPEQIKHVPASMFKCIASCYRGMGIFSSHFSTQAAGIDLWVFYTTTNMIGRPYGKRTFEDWLTDVKEGREPVDAKTLNMESSTWRAGGGGGGDKGSDYAQMSEPLAPAGNQ